MIKEKFGLTNEEGKLMAKVARRSHQVDAVYTWEKFQAMGYMWVMIPVINAMYDNEEDRIAGYKRHYELFNTNPVVGGFIRYRQRTIRILISLRLPQLKLP